LFGSKPRQLDDLYIESMHYDHKRGQDSSSKITLLTCLLGGSLDDIMSSGGSGKDSSSIGAGFSAQARLASINDEKHLRFRQ
jgi:hypothetical protein